MGHSNFQNFGCSEVCPFKKLRIVYRLHVAERRSECKQRDA